MTGKNQPGAREPLEALATRVLRELNDAYGDHPEAVRLARGELRIALEGVEWTLRVAARSAQRKRDKLAQAVDSELEKRGEA